MKISQNNFTSKSRQFKNMCLRPQSISYSLTKHICFVALYVVHFDWFIFVLFLIQSLEFMPIAHQNFCTTAVVCILRPISQHIDYICWQHTYSIPIKCIFLACQLIEHVKMISNIYNLFYCYQTHVSKWIEIKSNFLPSKLKWFPFTSITALPMIRAQM